MLRANKHIFTLNTAEAEAELHWVRKNQLKVLKGVKAQPSVQLGHVSVHPLGQILYFVQYLVCYCKFLTFKLLKGEEQLCMSVSNRTHNVMSCKTQRHESKTPRSDRKSEAP